MAKIISTLVDRKGNVIPNTVVVARERGNPSGDMAQATSGAKGQYILDVAIAGQEYDLWTTVEGSVGASNYMGVLFSSGDVVSSFTLCGDASWNIEHYGLTGTCGEHKATTHDSISMRTTGFYETADAFVEMRIGGTNETFRLLDSGDTVFFQPWLSGGTNRNIGLVEGPSGVGDISYMYFGSAKVRFINSNGAFNLLGGVFNDDVSIAAGDWTVAAGVAFKFTDHPQQVSYAAPTVDEEYTPKKYVDDEIAAAVSAPTNIIQQLDSSVEVQDTGTGQVVVTLDGIAQAVFTQGKFGIGGLFVPDELAHLKQADVATHLKVERTGTGASFTLLGEDSVGTGGSTAFNFKSNGTLAGSIDITQNWGLGVAVGSILEKLHIGGSIALDNYMRFTTQISTPSLADAEHAYLYLKQGDANNNELAAKIKKAGSEQEVIITSPQGYCSVCEKHQDAKDPHYNTKTGKMTLEFYCGHKYEISMNFTRVE